LELEIGTPEAMTRQKCLEKDDWVPLKTNKKEERDAKLFRGWLWPEDPLKRKKEAKKRKRTILDKGLK
jgi:hypothetical protein